MARWVPVINGVVHKQIRSHEIPRIGERVELLDDENYTVVDVVHFVSYNRKILPDVHLTKTKAKSELDQACVNCNYLKFSHLGTELRCPLPYHRLWFEEKKS